jgi:hypothetical protein
MKGKKCYSVFVEVADAFGAKEGSLLFELETGNKFLKSFH